MQSVVSLLPNNANDNNWPMGRVAEGGRELNRHRYRASQGIEVPAERFVISPNLRCSVGKSALNILRERCGSVGFVWADTEMDIGWACSWG